MAYKRLEFVGGKYVCLNIFRKATLRADAGMIRYALNLEEYRGSVPNIEFSIEQQRVEK